MGWCGGMAEWGGVGERGGVVGWCGGMEEWGGVVEWREGMFRVQEC